MGFGWLTAAAVRRDARAVRPPAAHRVAALPVGVDTALVAGDRVRVHAALIPAAGEERESALCCLI